MREIFVFGDSLSQGIVLDENGQYRVSRAGCIRLLKRNGFPIRNYAVHGYTVKQGMASFLNLTGEPGTVCVIQFGGNDCDLDWDAVSAEPERYHEGKLSLEDFKEETGAFVREVRKRGMIPVLVSPLALMAGRYCRWISRKRDSARILQYLRMDPESIYRWQERYATAVRDTADREKCAFLDVRGLMLNQMDYPDLMCMDGIHPNEAGHARLAEIISGQCANAIIT